MRRGTWGAFAALCAGAAYFVAVWVQQTRPTTAGIGYDLYAHYYPNALYLIGSVRDGLGGLLWNPYQACGKAWLAISSNGVLYPPNLLYLLLDADRAHLALTAFDLVVAGVGAFLLCRQLGAGVVGALCGALAFQLGNIAAWVTTWTPIIGAAYAWTPTILLCCERILRRPTPGGAIALGVAGTLAFLPGHPQVLFQVYQLVGLRILWELAVRGMHRPLATLTCLASGLVLPALLGAVQVLPAIELARASIRQGELTDAQIGAGLTWGKLRTMMTWRLEVLNPVQLVPVLLAAASPLRRATRPYAVFYLVAAAVSVVLAFGHSTPVFDLYLGLPLARTFRLPERFVWVTGLCLAVLAGLGADALVTRVREAPRGVVGRVGLSLAMLGLFAAYAVVAEGLLPIEWAIAVALAAIPLVRGARTARWVAATLVAALCANLAFELPSLPGVFGRGFLFSGLLGDPTTLIGSEAPLRALRARMTPQERAHLVPEPDRWHIPPKAASILRLRSLDDYEAQPTRRHAELFSMMRDGRAARGLNAVYTSGPVVLPDGFRRRLLDLQAARWVVVHASVDRTADVMSPPLRPIASHGDVRVYENAQALPRAYWVPQVAIVAERDQLAWLADGDQDLRRVAALAEPPPDGFLGEPSGAQGRVTFVTDDPTHLALRVEAPERGFLFVSDSYYPGWRATVDGRPAALLRANYDFRLVEVPAGTSVVEMRFRPASVIVGAAVSGATMLGIGVVLIVSRRRRPLPPR